MACRSAIAIGVGVVTTGTGVGAGIGRSGVAAGLTTGATCFSAGVNTTAGLSGGRTGGMSSFFSGIVSRTADTTPGDGGIDLGGAGCVAKEAMASLTGERGASGALGVPLLGTSLTARIASCEQSAPGGTVIEPFSGASASH